MAAAVLARAWGAISGIWADDPALLLMFPLGVVVPALIFIFLARTHRFKTAEGALMQLGTLIQLVLIVGVPKYTLHLALGFPVVFLVVELFETRVPKVLRNPIRNWVLS